MVSIHHGWTLFIMYDHCSSWMIGIHHGWSVFIVDDQHSSWFIIIHHGSSVVIMDHGYASWIVSMHELAKSVKPGWMVRAWHVWIGWPNWRTRMLTMILVSWFSQLAGYFWCHDSWAIRGGGAGAQEVEGTSRHISWVLRRCTDGPRHFMKPMIPHLLALQNMFFEL
jgi:hypothetical protein